MYEATQQKMEMLRRAGYTVIEKWEGEFAKDKKTDKTLQDFSKSFELVEPLNPPSRRMAFVLWTLYLQSS